MNNIKIWIFEGPADMVYMMIVVTFVMGGCLHAMSVAMLQEIGCRFTSDTKKAALHSLLMMIIAPVLCVYFLIKYIVKWAYASVSVLFKWWRDLPDV